MTRTGFSLALLVATAASAQAQVELGLRDLMQARNYSMAGAYRALAYGTEGIGGNPAAIASFQRYQIELGGAWDVAGKSAHGSVAVLDSVSSPLAMGVSYNLVSFGQGGLRRTAHLNTVAAALPVMQNLLWAGASARHLIMSGAATANAITADAGLMVKLLEGLYLGAGAHNFIDTGHPELSRYYTLSAGWLLGVIGLAADLRADFNAAQPLYAISVGAEYVFGQFMPIRVGYEFDDIGLAQNVAGGIGFMTQGGTIDFAYRHDISGGGRLVALSVRLQL